MQKEIRLDAGDKLIVYVAENQGAGDETIKAPPWTDIRAQMPVNTQPDQSWLKSEGRTGWWQRSLDQIDGITLHHTMIHDIVACANYITRPVAEGGKGLPTTQYAFWVAADGRSSYCVNMTEAPWHDHCGDENTHLSVGLAGHLDKTAPPQAQLEGVVKLVAYLMQKLNLGIESVNGHREWSEKYKGKPLTACPGWISGGWREQFFALLRAEINPAGASFSVSVVDNTVAEQVLAAHDEGQ